MHPPKGDPYYQPALPLSSASSHFRNLTQLSRIVRQCLPRVIVCVLPSHPTSTIVCS